MKMIFKTVKKNLWAAVILGAATFAETSSAKISVLTTTSDLAALAAEIGGDEVAVESICKGTQDPHYIEAKPSYMVKASKADLILAIGLDLEVGWLPSILQGARNPKVLPTSPTGYLEVGPLVEPLEVPGGKITRKDGDVHPGGNPHVLLDPLRAGQIANEIAKRLAMLVPAHGKVFSDRARLFTERMQKKTALWQERVKKSGVSKVISYHKTLTYFFNRFQIENSGILEPKPGIPPTAQHIMAVIQLVKKEKIPLIMVENFFDSAVTEKILREVQGLKVKDVPVAVGGEEGINSLDDLYEVLIQAVESAKVGQSNHG